MPYISPITNGETGLSARSKINQAFNYLGIARESLASPRTYYVSTSGSDTNNGTSAATAFRTWAYALNQVARLDGKDLTVTILGSGTFNESITVDHSFTGIRSLTLSAASLGSCTINPTGLPAINVLTKSTIIKVGNLILGGSSNFGILVNYGQLEIVSPCNFGAVSQIHIYVESSTSRVRVLSNYTISGAPAIAHIQAIDGGLFDVNTGSAITITGTSNFNIPVAANTAWIQANRGGKILLVLVTWPSNFTGRKYIVDDLSSITRVGGTTMPGNTAGTLSSLGNLVDIN